MSARSKSTVDTRALLLSTLELAVPLWVDRLRQQPLSEILARAPTLSQTIAEHGDDILFKSKRKGDTAKAFNALAESLAALSFMPGGVTFLGRTWVFQHPEMV